jgi:glycosyltransferase involved in cell wall biosynthesis
VRFSEGWVPIDDLLEAISRADAGVVAMKRDAFRDLTHCNKMYDLVTMRRPVINSRTRSVQAYFDDECFEYFDSSDPADLARAMRRMHDEPERRERLVARATDALEPYRWPRQQAVYLSYIDRLLGTRRADGGAADAR